jgi:acyl-[acyl-carrier-protein]-phospholipid O-acyltransferase/long-chain-fatty-acid--[acyl-carrier-protein] ligase
VGILPFFHSFGYTVTIWLTLLSGWSAIYHPSPLEPKAIAQLIYEHRATFLVAAPTFLQNFLRRCQPEELSSINHVITGAEKLPSRLREAFRDTFGVEPLEGYGTTECAPVVSVNIPDQRAPGYFQVGTKHGTIGQPIPGVSVRVVDPDTYEPLGPDESGMLLVKGPNIMGGYLNDPERTRETFHGAWYITGDIAAVDEDGFITITDRLARFSKIGGEMVPHTRIEESLHALLGLSEQALAVTGVPDESKGERLVVLHTLTEEQESELLEKLPQSDLPNLWRPRANAFHRIDEIPILGTGKLNLRAVKERAKQVEGVDA